MWPLLAQATAPEAPSWLASLGYFTPFGGLALLVIWWQARKIDKLENDKDVMAASTLPALTEATHALREASAVQQSLLERERPAG